MSDADLGNKSKDQLIQFAERIETLLEEKKGILDDIKDVKAEAKANGFDIWALNECIKRRAMEPHTRQERDAVLETYFAAFGIE